MRRGRPRTQPQRVTVSAVRQLEDVPAVPGGQSSLPWAGCRECAPARYALVDTLEGRKTAIREKARETKAEGVEMMKTYLGGEEEALDGFEFLSMAEAGELAHWEIVQKIAHTVGERRVAELADWAVPVQRGHIETVREASLALAVEEAKEMASA